MKTRKLSKKEWKRLEDGYNEFMNTFDDVVGDEQMDLRLIFCVGDHRGMSRGIYGTTNGLSEVMANLMDNDEDWMAICQIAEKAVKAKNAIPEGLRDLFNDFMEEKLESMRIKPQGDA